MLLTGLSRRLFTDRPASRVGNRHPETYPVDSFSTKDGDIVLVGFSDGIVKQVSGMLAFDSENGSASHRRCERLRATMPPRPAVRIQRPSSRPEKWGQPISEKVSNVA